MIKKKVITLAIISTIFFSCKEKFEPPVTEMNLNYLVVDGTIVNGADSTIIRLSRTQLLNQNPATLGERNADVSLEDAQGNTVYNFVQVNQRGDYAVPGMSLDVNKQYHLRINAANGSQYLSADLPVKETPAIDSISWQQTNDGVTIYANTHDPNNNTRYYSWTYVETYDYFSNYFSTLTYNASGTNVDELFPARKAEDLIYHCWKTTRSNQILLGSSIKLSADVISLAPIRFIPTNTIELNSVYSILVNQFGISKEAFQYFENIKKISEQSGSLFDAQPSQLVGNIKCINKPAEAVIGYLTIASLQQQRIFIRKEQVKPWNYVLFCPPEKNVPINLDSFTFYFGGSSPMLIPTAEIFMPPGVGGATQLCTDCTLRGGANVKPDFWP